MKPAAASRQKLLRCSALTAICLGCLQAATSVAQTRGFALYGRAILGGERIPSLKVSTEVSYSNLVFLRGRDDYRANYEVYLSITGGPDKKAVRTFVLRGEAAADTFEDTSLREKRSVLTKTIPLIPGEYRVEATLRVKRTHLAYRREMSVVVPDFLKSGVGFSTPEVLSVAASSAQPVVRWADFEKADREAVVDGPIDYTLAIFDNQPAVRFALYLEAQTAGYVECDLFYEVLDATDKRTLYGKQTLHLSGGDDEFVLSFPVDDWEPGPYQVNLRAITANEKREAATSIKFNIDVTRAMLGVSFDDTMEILALIADKEELEALRNAAEEDRPREWSKFWGKRDPDPSTRRNEALEEHFARLRVVAERYSTFSDGWRTDRGQIYIRYGPPDRVDRASDQQYRGEYEIWRYYSMNRVFVFYDMFGMGDFRLVEGALF